MKYSYFDSIKSRQCQQVTVEQLIDKLKTPYIKNVASGVLKLLDEGKEDEASKLKSSLPVIVLGQLYEDGKPRSKDGGQPTGLLMIDYDDCKTVEEAKQLMQHIKEKWLSDILLRDIIVAAHYSPRMHGVHIWYRWIDGCHSYAECNERIAKLLERPDYDEACKDNSRCSFLVPIEYFEIQNWDAMAKNEEYAKLQALQEDNSSTPPPRQQKVVLKKDEEPLQPSKDFPQEYDGIKYDVITSALTKKCAPPSKIDAEGNVLEGARDNTYFKVACLLRYLTDNNAEWLYSLAPSWAHDLGESRLMELCKNACKRNLSFSYPRTLVSVLDSFKQGDKAAEANKRKEQEEEDQQKFAVEEMQSIDESLQKFLIFPKKLPPIFQEFCDGVKPEWKAAVVMTLLPTLGTLMSKVRAKYIDKRFHSTSFQTVIEAKMASGKQNYADIADFILTPITMMDLEGNTQLNLYNQEVEKANNSKSISSPPDVCVRKMIGKFTEAGLNDVLNTSKGLHIWSGVSEIDEVASVWKELSYILRLAYDNSGYGRTLQSRKQFRGERKLYLNTFLCGTPRAIARVYNDPEDGLVSRTIFYKHMVETPGVPITKVSQQQMNKMLKLLQKIHDKYTINPDGVVANETRIDLDYVNRHLQKWLDNKSLEATKYASESLERFRRRDACNGFRAAMVAHIVYINSNRNGKVSEADKKVIREFAEWVAEYSLMMHDYKFGGELNQILAEDAMQHGTKKVEVLSLLPNMFTLAEAYRTLKHHTPSSVRGLLTRLAAKNLIVQEERGVYSKVKPN